MAKVIGKDQLCSTDLDYFKALQGVEGKTLFDRYQSLKNIVNVNIDAQYRHFLAEPVKDENIIIWFGAIYNETPKVLSELQAEELEKYTQLKKETLAHYNNKINSLKLSDKNNEAIFLEDAVKFVDDRFVYCYDDKVVLGVWGMQLRENVRESIGEIRKNLFVQKKKEKAEPIPTIAPEPKTPFTIVYNAGENGVLDGYNVIQKQPNEFISDYDIPTVEAKEGFEFIGWNEEPNGFEVTEDKEFTAQYRPLEVPPLLPSVTLPWYKRFWNWLLALFTGKGCLRWLFWLLAILIFLLLLSFLLKNCHGCRGPQGGAALGNNDSTWVREDSRVSDGGGIYDPNNPYTPLPTPPGYEDILPPYQGVLPPVNDNPEIIPGNPSIIGNRLNILMENENKSIMDLAKDFKIKYPEDKYKVIYYDDVVKRMQIEVPSEERIQLKQEFPEKFASQYELFVFDETLFEGTYIPNDPAFTDLTKVWHLNAINAPKAWDISRGSERITIAIVDNGFNLSHPELKNKVLMPYNVWKHSKEIFPQQVDHGTLVAGTALAYADNGKGISGIAPLCSLMPVQVADANGLMTTTSVLDGILYALYQGADVVNVSLGSQFTDLAQFPEDFQRNLIQNHFKEEERLWKHVMKIAASHNSTIVIAAGNDNVLAGIDPIQRQELFVTVSAVDKNNQNLNKANFSNYGSYSTISAPGVGIYSSSGTNNYETKDGTSMAAPIVSGAVALIKSLNDSLTTKQIICILQSTGLPTQGNIGKLIQLDKALQTVKSGEAVDCTPIPSTGDVQLLLNWNNYNDLDLCCTDPMGETIWFKNKRASSGGLLEIDMNVEYPDNKNPTENIYWPSGSAPEGTYNVYLLYYKKHESGVNETPYTLKVKYGNKTDEYNGTIKMEDNVINICSFTLGNASPIQQTQRNIPDSRYTSPTERRRTELEKEQLRLQQELVRVNDELRRIGSGR